MLYGDDRVPLLYEGEFNVQSLVEYVLKKFEDMVSKRSFSAKELQKWLEFEEKEKERAKKEWDEEQERRKKSDTLLLTKDNW